MQNKASLHAFVMEQFKQLPSHYYYHNLAHTLYVVKKSIIIAKHSKCTQNELDLLTVAALLHDIGFLKTYHQHEEASCKFVKKQLPKFGFTKKEINTICETILATKIPQTPTNNLGKILADADVEYLGTAKALSTSKKLFKELHCINPQLSIKDWNQLQIKFLQQHHYFTNYCLLKKTPKKLAYLNYLICSGE
jgi:uncharacterized protein